MGGKSAWGLIRTGNALDKGEPTGPYVAVLSKDCSSLRFSSTMPSCGPVDVRNGARWGGVRGTVKGKPMALLLVPALMIAADTRPPDKKKKSTPPTGKVYALRPDAPGWVTCDLDVRDPAEGQWPNFFYGKPAAAGTFAYDPKAPKASFVLNCDQRVQRNGDQSRRVLGDLLEDNASLAARLTVRSLVAVRSEDEETTDSKGRTSRRPVEYAPFSGTLELGDQQVEVKGKATYRFSKAGDDGGPESVYLDLRFNVKGSDLGLTKITGNLECRAGATGYLKPPTR